MKFAQIRPGICSGKKLYIETYGCQMNTGDSEIVVSILSAEGAVHTEDPDHADIILVNTCSVRDNAEQRIWGRLGEFKRLKRNKKDLIVGVIGCMAERLKESLLEKEKIVDIIAGPDSYRDLPRLVRSAGGGDKGINVLLSGEETYAEIAPVRLDKNGINAFVSIMRGCNNMCSYCVVPYTRGRERSRDPQTIISEVRELFNAGYREVTLLGQNVNSYTWQDENGEKIDFPDLISKVAGTDPLLRVRFATSHPKDLSDKLIDTIASHPNICRSIHLPAQSGSTRMLDKMNRKYSREWYLGRVEAIKNAIPDCSITTDLIAGFCSETDEDHKMTLSLMKEVGYDFAFMFKYSERPDTKAARHYPDDVPEEIKTARLNEIISLQNSLSAENNRRDVGKTFEILIEGESKRNPDQLYGRTSHNKVVVFDKGTARAGEYTTVRITGSTSATLFGEITESQVF